MDYGFLRPVCLILSACAILAGGAGMALSFLVMTMSSMEDVTAGTSGFVAGAVLIGSGLISLTLLSCRPTRVEERDDRLGAIRYPGRD